MIGRDLGLRLGRETRARAAARNASSETRSSGSGASERNGSSGPARARDACGSPRRSARAAPCAASWNVLHSSSRASRRSRSSKRMQLLVERRRRRGPGSRRRALSSTSVAAISRNSVATVEIDPLHLLDLGAEHVDDPRERDLPEVDLFLEDEVQQEVERAFEDRRRHLVRHVCIPVRITRSSHARRSARCTGPNHKIVVAGYSPGEHGAAGSVRPHGTGLFGHQAHRRDAARQLPRRGAPLGRRPARGRLERGRCTTTRSSASSTSTR